MGFPQIGYQAFKLLAHQRLHELAKRWEERYPGVDIVLIEPEPTDELMFQTSMMSFTSRVEIARHGFESVTKHLAGEYERYQEVAERHGLEISGERLRKVVEHFDDEPEQVSAWRKILEGTTGALLRQSGSARAARPATALCRRRASRRVVAAVVADADAHVPGLAERVAGRHEHAGPRQARGQLAAVDGGMGGPHEVGLAVGHLEAALAQGGAQARALPRRSWPRAARAAPSRCAAPPGRPAWETSETPRSGSSSASSSSEPGPPIA